MAAKRVIEVEILGDSSKLTGAFKEADDKSGKFGSALSSVGGVAGAVAAGGLAAVVEAGHKFIDAAKEAEVGQVALKAQLSSAGESYGKYRDRIDGVIDRTSKLSAFNKEDLTDSLTNLVRATGSASKGMSLLGLAADVARAKHISVAKAGELVGKVADGNTTVLKKYGITLDKNATSSEALAALQGKVAGQAKAFGDSAEGASQKASNATHNLEVMVGDQLLPAYNAVVGAIGQFVSGIEDGSGAGGVFASVFRTAIDVIKDVVDWLGQNKDIVIAVGGAIGGVVVALGAYEAATAAATAVTEALDAVLAANPIGLVVVALAALAAGVIYAYEKSDTFRTIVQTAFTDVKTAGQALVDFLKPAIEGAFDFIKGVVDRILPAVVQTFDGFKTSIKGIVDLIGDVFHGRFGDIWGDIKDIFSGAIEAVLGILRAWTAPAREAVSRVLDAVSGAVSSGWGDIKDFLSGAAGGITHFLAAPFSAALGPIEAVIRDVKGAISDITSLPGKALHGLGIPGFASGTMSAPGGLALVGENGPELVNLPRGSQVFTAGQTAAMAAPAGGGTTLNIYGPVGSSRAALTLADQLAYRLAFG